MRTRPSGHADGVADEIERRFLIDDVADAVRRSGRSDELHQGYLVVDEAGSQVRVRRRGEETSLTVKRGAGLRRSEVEIEISAGDFERLWELTDGRRIEKRRHLVEADGLTYEIDVYGGALEGFALVEVEFGSEASAAAFEPPAWFGREITGEEAYSNVALATRGLPGGRR